MHLKLFLMAMGHFDWPMINFFSFGNLCKWIVYWHPYFDMWNLQNNWLFETKCRCCPCTTTILYFHASKSTNHELGHWIGTYEQWINFERGSTFTLPSLTWPCPHSTLIQGPHFPTIPCFVWTNLVDMFSQFGKVIFFITNYLMKTNYYVFFFGTLIQKCSWIVNNVYHFCPIFGRQYNMQCLFAFRCTTCN